MLYMQLSRPGPYVRHPGQLAWTLIFLIAAYVSAYSIYHCPSLLPSECHRFVIQMARFLIFVCLIICLGHIEVRRHPSRLKIGQERGDDRALKNQKPGARAGTREADDWLSRLKQFQVRVYDWFCTYTV